MTVDTLVEGVVWRGTSPVRGVLSFGVCHQTSFSSSGVCGGVLVFDASCAPALTEGDEESGAGGAWESGGGVEEPAHSQGPPQ